MFPLLFYLIGVGKSSLFFLFLQKFDSKTGAFYKKAPVFCRSAAPVCRNIGTKCRNVGRKIGQRGRNLGQVPKDRQILPKYRQETTKDRTKNRPGLPKCRPYAEISAGVTRDRRFAALCAHSRDSVGCRGPHNAKQTCRGHVCSVGCAVLTDTVRIVLSACADKGTPGVGSLRPNSVWPTLLRF